MGGNIWDNSVPIIREDIEGTVSEFFKELVGCKSGLVDIVKTFTFIGSVGKKDISGDIDIAISSDSLYPNNGRLITEFDISQEEYKERLELLKSRAKTATIEQLEIKSFLQLLVGQMEDCDIIFNEEKIGYNSLNTLFNIYHNNVITDDKVQIDIIITDNIEWAKFAYFSSIDSEYKGLHRTQLIISMLTNIGYSFSHSNGFKEKESNIWLTDIDALIDIIKDNYNVENLTYEGLLRFEDIYPIVENNNNVKDIYLKILNKTRTYIPDELIEYRLENMDRLNLDNKYTIEK
jgi:hypothetical protein